MLNSNHNHVEKSDQEVMKHMCKLCNKSFSCGRSLGGHMRSHVINSTDHHHRQKMKMKITSLNNNDGNPMNNNTEVMNGSSNSNDLCYELRKDPKKTLKAKDSNEPFNNCLVVLDKICKECGKGFQSWKALFGHMKCHSDKVSNTKTAILKQDSWISQPDNENLGAKSLQMKKSRSRNGTTKKSVVTCATTPTLTTTTTATATTTSSSVSMNANHASTSVVSDIDQEQETEVAMCLIMLSRDVGKWGKKITGNGYKMKKLVETEVGFDRLGKTIINRDEFDDQSNRKVECTTCNKSFHTYQALGGHKASHKLKECFDSKTNEKNSIKNEPMLANDYMINGYCEKTSDNHKSTSSFNLGGSLKNTMVLGVGAHECSICLRIFSSGQALGGHKRSHLIAEAKLNQQNLNLIEKFDKPVHELRGFLDLNMPPDSEEQQQQETMMMNTSTTGTGYNPWYYNHESTLLGLLSTS